MARAEASTPECVYGSRIHSRIACTVPSSPKRPCRALNTASGRTSRSWAIGSSPGSTATGSTPSWASAAITPRPEDRLTSRSALRPPMRTAMRRNGLALLCIGHSVAGGHPHALDLPFQLHAGLFPHPPPDFLAQGFQLGRGGAAGVDQEIGVFLADLCAADRQSPGAGLVHQRPRLVAGRVL